MIVYIEKCTSCGICVRDCPLEAIRLQKGKPVVNEQCSRCGACVKFCPEEALTLETSIAPEAVQCDACPIGCFIKPGYKGACLRYTNQDNQLIRIEHPQLFSEVTDIVGKEPQEAIRQPLVTALGSGTTYPDCRPAPYIVKGKQADVDVVTVTTEAPLLYSTLMLKIDTDIPLGDEGSPVTAKKEHVGMVSTDQYGSKILSIGGPNLLAGPNGLLVARTLTDVANRKRVKLKISNGARLELQVGMPPVIDGETAGRRIVGCGSATVGMFAPILKKAADEVIVLSHPPHSGMLSEHAAGRFLGVRKTGVRLNLKQGTPGRYIAKPGKGWGGTSITDPATLIRSVDLDEGQPGMRILITEPTGKHAALYEVDEKGGLRESTLTPDVRQALESISESCEMSMVSGVYIGGAGGSARAGVTHAPLALTKAVHGKKANLTVGGAPVFLFPGGGINFMVDVERVKPSFFYWTPTPAIICPIEYTITYTDYQEMGGHIGAMRPFEALEPKPLM
jgi:Pyruvate/2-oxoacid:ferredoxin oxidoreductase delta subunit